MITRRSFLLSSAAAAAAACGSGGPRITRIRYVPVECRFHKFVAMNSYDDEPKGETYENTLVRVETDAGVEGVAVMGYDDPDEEFHAALAELIGADPLSVYEFADGRLQGAAAPFQDLLSRYPHLDGPLLDLVGKLTQRPCWRMIGDAVRDRIEVYDGSLYFADILHEERGVEAVVEEAKQAFADGYHAMKFKTGRGWKWMDPEPGLARDIEVIQAVREALGPGAKILTDANNGYRDNLEHAWTFLSETRDAKLYWLEEPFPEEPQRYQNLRAKMREAGIETLLADGESVSEPSAFDPYLQPEPLIDVLQMDIRNGGIRRCLESARRAAAAGVYMVPHNWASRVGLLESLHLSKAVENILGAEDDRSQCDVVSAPGYEFADGHYTVPDNPGFGLEVVEEVYQDRYIASERVVS